MTKEFHKKIIVTKKLSAFMHFFLYKNKIISSSIKKSSIQKEENSKTCDYSP